MLLRSPYDRHRVPTVIEGPSRTEASHAEASDINYIVKRFARTGSLPPPTRQGTYADCTPFSGSLLERLEWADEIITAHNASQNALQGPSEPLQGSDIPPPATPVASTP